jgi:hypothetical protein
MKVNCMTKDIKTTKAFSLLELGKVIEDAVNDGYTVAEGWPLQFGWWYEIQFESSVSERFDTVGALMADLDAEDVPPVNKPKAGRPKAAKIEE